MSRYYRLILLIFISVILFSCKDYNSDPIEPGLPGIYDKEEAFAAFEYLNLVRENPNAFSTSIGVDLSYVTPRHQLKWNDVLQKVAEDKAKDLADNRYFAHVDNNGYGINYYMDKAGYPMSPAWLTKPENNYFESLAANSTTNYSGKQFIDQLIIDKGVESLGHRKHLLGIDSSFAWNSTLVECGAAIFRKDGTPYVNYFVCIIAKPGNQFTETFILPYNIE